MAAGTLTMPTARRALGAGIAIVALVADVGAAFFMVATIRAGEGASIDFQTLGGFILGGAYSIVGWLIAQRRPGNVIGWIFLVIGLSQAIDTLASEAAFYGLRIAPGTVPFAEFMSWLSVWAWAPGYTLFVTLSVLLFPDGRLPSPRWRPVAWAAIGILALLTIPIAVVTWAHQGAALVPLGQGPVPPDVGAVEDAVQTVGIASLVVVAVASVLGLVVRFRRSAGIERQQLKWFTFAGIVEIGVVLVVDSASTSIPATFLAVLVAPLLPVAATVAILRYRLYDIDRIISRTLAYGALTAILAVVYGVGFFVLQGVLAPFTNGRPIAVAASTLVAFALFQPLRRWIQGLVDRRFYRTRYDADRTVAALAQRLRDEVDLGTLQAALTDTASGSLGPTRAGVWIRPTSGSPR
jgi:hypothetical protein